MVAATVNEPGCLTYEFSRVLGHASRFRVYEEWQDQAALEADFATPHMAASLAVLGEVRVISSDISRVVGGQQRRLG